MIDVRPAEYSPSCRLSCYVLRQWSVLYVVLNVLGEYSAISFSQFGFFSYVGRNKTVNNP